MPGQFSFRARFLTLGAIFILGYAALIVVVGTTLGRVRIGGALYNEVVQDHDLLADIAPPPKFIVEPYLLCYQIADAEDVGQRNALIARLRHAIAQYEERHRHWDAVVTDPLLRTPLLVTSTEAAREFFQVVEQEFLPAVADPASAATSVEGIIESRLDPTFDRHRTAIEDAVTQAQARIVQHEEHAAAAVLTGRILAIVVTVAVLAVIAIGGVWVARGVLGGMGLVIARMREMALADADLSARLEVQSKDEVGELAKWFNALLDKFSALIRQVRNSSIQLNSSATEVAATSRHQEESVSSLSSSTSQIAAATHEISSTGSELLSTMGEVSGIAQSTAASAAAGSRSVSKMSSTMQTLEESSESISSRLAAINTKANDITTVVTTINKVADQTNLLSVNAAIEAEKAGEYGRGFLIVAREIRRLADQTATATLDIEKTVDQMQSAVSTGVMEMDKFRDQVRHTVDEVTQIGGKLTEIIEQVEVVTERFDAVNEGMASQGEGVEQINAAMTADQRGDDIAFRARAQDVGVAERVHIGRRRDARRGHDAPRGAGQVQAR
jgi:methyl-accepting chemotaxis protein WspA